MWRGELLAWQPGGHRQRPRPAGVRVSVLTPASTVAAIRAGCVPHAHPSAFARVRVVARDATDEIK